MNGNKSLVELRKRAEEILDRKREIIKQEMPDLEALLQDLEIHQVELEIQNEELRQARDEWQKSRDEYFSLYNSAICAYVTLNSEKEITRFNQTAENLLGQDRIRIKSPFVILVYEEDRPQYFKTLQKSRDEGHMASCELRVSGREGRMIHVLLEASADANEEASLLWHLTLTDITIQKKSEEKIQRQNQLTKAINRIFAASVDQTDDERFAKVCLAAAEKITGSTVSLLAETGPDGLMHDIAMSSPAREACSIKNMKGRLPGDLHIKGMYGSVVLKGSSLVKNNPPSGPDRFKLPEGHPPLTAFMGVPFKEQGRVTGMVAVGNRKGGYGNEDLKSLEILALVISEALSRRHGEKALMESEARLKVVTESALLGTWDFDLLGDNSVWSSTLFKILGRNLGDTGISIQIFFKYVHPEDAVRLREHFEETLKKGKEFYDEFRIIRSNGAIVWLAASGRLYRDTRGRPVRMAGVSYDITDRKSLENELHSYRNELEKRVRERTADMEEQYNRRRFLARNLVKLVEKERSDIAMSLHDNVGQLLVAGKMELELLRADVEEKPVLKKIKSVEKNLEEAIKFVRNISRDLRPASLDRLGLVACLGNLIDDMRENSDITIKFYSSEVLPRPDHDRDLAIYRIVQESLNNVIKHADAEEVSVNLTCKDNRLRLSVEDDGKGFDFRKVSRSIGSRRGPLGLSIMRERAAQVGGELWIETEKGRGTLLAAEFPVG